MKKHGGDQKEKRLKKLGNVAVYPLKQGQLEVMFQLHKKWCIGNKIRRALYRKSSDCFFLWTCL